MKFEQKSCDICYCEWFSTAQESKLQCRKESSVLPGSDGCSSLNEHLRTYFITTKLLKLPEAEFIKLIRHFSSSVSRAVPSTSRSPVEISGGNRKLIYSVLCARCESIVNEALEMHGQLVELQRKIDKFGAMLFEIKEIADKARNKTSHSYERQHNNSSLASCIKDETAKQMFDLTLTCLGKVPFPPPRKITKPDNSSRKLRSSEKARPLSKKEGALRATIPGANDDVILQVKQETHVEQLEQDDLDNDPGILSPPMDFNVNDDIINDNENDTYVKAKSRIKRNSQLYSDDDTDEEVETENTEEIPENENSDIDYEPAPEEEDNSEDEDGDSASNDEKSKVDLSDDSDVEDDDEVEVMDDDGKILAHFTTDQIPSRTNNNSGKQLEFQCNECHKIFSHRRSLHSHTRCIHKFEVLYDCSKCPGLKFSRKTLIEHRNKVHGNVCEKCGKSLATRHTLFRHYEMVHMMKLKYNCTLCKKVFQKASQLQAHRGREHIVNQDMLSRLPPREPETPEEEEWSKIPCEDCGRRYLAGEKLDYHLLNIHEKRLSKKEKEFLRTKCFFCWRNFHHKQRRFVHIKMAHPEMAFPCEHCSDVTFSNCSELVTHYDKEHEDMAIYNCGKCGWPFLEEDVRKEHEKVHMHVDPNKGLKKAAYQFKCWFCWEVFPDEEKLQRHVKTSRRHLKRDKVEFVCDVHECHHRLHPFDNVDQRNEHVQVAHGDIHHGEIQFCPECSWACVSKDSLAIHKLNHEHRKNAKYSCPSCGHICRLMSSLIGHYNTHHGLNLKLYKCKVCSQGFKTLQGLQQHFSSVHKKQTEEENPSLTLSKIPCDACGKLYANEVVLRQHQNAVHQDHQCPDCGEILKTLTKFKTHVKRIHGRGEQHLCSLCGKSFLDKHGLQIHMRFHREKKYECHVCHRRMADLEDMKKHIKKVHENKPKKDGPPPKFVCAQCELGFSRKDTLDDHVRVHHTRETRRVWSCFKCSRRFTRKLTMEKHQMGRGCTGLSETVII